MTATLMNPSRWLAELRTPDARTPALARRTRDGHLALEVSTRELNGRLHAGLDAAGIPAVDFDLHSGTDAFSTTTLGGDPAVAFLALQAAGWALRYTAPHLPIPGLHIPHAYEPGPVAHATGGCGECVEGAA